MEGPERGREQFNDAVGWLTFPPGREVDARHSRISSASAAPSVILNTVLLSLPTLYMSILARF